MFLNMMLGGKSVIFFFSFSYICMEKLSFDEFRRSIIKRAEMKPDNWRYGQAVFNYTEELYGDIARKVQKEDCFYDDNKAEDFIKKCYELYNPAMNIHFYTDINDENQVPDELLSDLCLDMKSTRSAIERRLPEIHTTQVSLLSTIERDYLKSCGYDVYYHVNNSVFKY